MYVCVYLETVPAIESPGMILQVFPVEKHSAPRDAGRSQRLRDAPPAVELEKSH